MEELNQTIDHNAKYCQCIWKNYHFQRSVQIIKLLYAARLRTTRGLWMKQHRSDQKCHLQLYFLQPPSNWYCLGDSVWRCFTDVVYTKFLLYRVALHGLLFRGPLHCCNRSLILVLRTRLMKLQSHEQVCVYSVSTSSMDQHRTYNYWLIIDLLLSTKKACSSLFSRTFHQD